MLCTFTMSYFCFDLVTMIFVLKDSNNSLGRQHIIHHFVGIFIGMLALLGGMQMPKLFSVAMICEFSQIFMNLRNIMGKNKWKGQIATCNQVAFFLSYTMFRVMLFPMLIYSNVKCSYLYDYENTTILHKFAFWFNTLMFLGIYLLNLFWYNLIVKGLLLIVFPKKALIEVKQDDEYN